jgi:hypothetical protein
MDCGGEVRPNRRCNPLGCPTPRCSPLERTEIGRQKQWNRTPRLVSSSSCAKLLTNVLHRWNGLSQQRPEANKGTIGGAED